MNCMEHTYLLLTDLRVLVSIIECSPNLSSSREVDIGASPDKENCTCFGRRARVLASLCDADFTLGDNSDRRSIESLELFLAGDSHDRELFEWRSVHGGVTLCPLGESRAGELDR